ncbi:hypothetical protein GIB67_031289 [Kingdonia uniflora]|uniref:HRDC domain-containing protein n=1 Tax=Kingdonia uniflora TaxID=39325 RepID=A0A7J7P5P3_9MAGN|nr:hypothetical protein GIB67_031289 [Kingdonia uniflora]
MNLYSNKYQRVSPLSIEIENPKLISMEPNQGGFELVSGKKKKKSDGSNERVPFHASTITRPQEFFNIFVDNSNRPFGHVWLGKSEDGTRFIHPLENLSEVDFVDINIGDSEPDKPLPIEATPFKLVEDVRELKDLATTLQRANEFAVDLEHNYYRSFQGLTCLMQISTRTEDFAVDTLKLRVHIGPYLRDLFKDPSKKKVMHGADLDILWLQRDFGIYVCNLFDTGQASKVLKFKRNTLEYLLQHFCEVFANKEYQKADWRQRPLPNEMLKYAREDTHYLLHIYDLMRRKLISESIKSVLGDDLLLEVYKSSYDICMKLYEKEILSDTSYLHIYGLHGADFDAHQLAIVSGLYQWRDAVARHEDESTGYIMPNKTLLKIAKQMPLSKEKLLQLDESKHPYVEHNVGYLVSIIRSSVLNAAAFESATHELKMRPTELATMEQMQYPQPLPVQSSSRRNTQLKPVALLADITTNLRKSSTTGTGYMERKENRGKDDEHLPFSKLSSGFQDYHHLTNEKREPDQFARYSDVRKQTRFVDIQEGKNIKKGLKFLLSPGETRERTNVPVVNKVKISFPSNWKPN